MSIQQLLLGASGASGYLMDKSLRFRASASASLNRTPASAGNRKTWTWSAWVKRGALPGNFYLMSAGGSYTDAGFLGIGMVDIGAGQAASFNVTTGTQVLRRSNAQYRDPSSWYHLLVAFDTTQASAANRVLLYVNGAQVTSFALSNDPSLNGDYGFNQGSVVNYIGRASASVDNYFDGYMAEVNFIDGQALTPASFGDTNALTGVWQPAPYTGSYGTNGFYLDFENTSSVAALGTDDSGNGNTWTVNNISLTAGVTYDSMTDVPTLTSATAANYAVLNPLSKFSGTVLTEGNLKIASGGTEVWYPAASSIKIPTSGKYYCEFTIGALDLGVLARHYIGIITDQFPISTSTGIGNSLYGWGYYADDGSVYNNTIVIASLTASTTNDVIGVAFNSDAGTLRFYKNGSAMGSDLTGFTSSYYFACATFGNSSPTGFINFGQRPFAYTPPTGFVALNTFNLPTSTILDGAEYFNAVLWTGNGTTQSIDVGFQPDFVWHKTRSTANNHILLDSVRGEDQILYSNLTNAEATRANSIALTPTGYTLEDNWSNRNGAGITYVGWNWKAGGVPPVTNTDGTITSTVSVNATAGFSVVTYTGNGTAGATVGHGLGVAPSFVIYKIRSSTVLWVTYLQTLGNTGFLPLNQTNAFVVDSTVFNNTSPTSGVLTLGTSGGTNSNTNTYVAYCFAPIAGYSAMGTYTGNGSTDGTFVYCGFRPKYVLKKRTDSTGSWYINDSARDTYNVAGLDLYADLSNAETNESPIIDFLSNGFKLRTSGGALNASGGTYAYIAFAENPFKNSLAR